MTKSELKDIDQFAKDGIIIFTLKDGSLQLFISRDKDEYCLFDGKVRNQYNSKTLNDIWGNQIITLKKM